MNQDYFLGLNPLWVFNISEFCEFIFTSTCSTLVQKSPCKLQSKFRGLSKVSLAVPQLQCEFGCWFLCALAQALPCAGMTLAVSFGSCSTEHVHTSHGPVMEKVQTVVPSRITAFSECWKIPQDFSHWPPMTLNECRHVMPHTKTCTGLLMGPCSDTLIEILFHSVFISFPCHLV